MGDKQQDKYQSDSGARTDTTVCETHVDGHNEQREVVDLLQKVRARQRRHDSR